MKTYLQKGNINLLILNHRTSCKVFINRVILIKANVNYSTFYMDGGREKRVAHSMKFFEPYLITQGFLRVHRAFMINPNYVKTYNPGAEVLTMSNGQIATIARRRRSILKNLEN